MEFSILVHCAVPQNLENNIEQEGPISLDVSASKHLRCTAQWKITFRLHFFSPTNNHMYSIFSIDKRQQANNQFLLPDNQDLLSLKGCQPMKI